MPTLARIAAVLIAFGAVSGCATAPEEQSCQPGEERMRTAQLFFGRNIDQPPVVTEVQFREFVAQEITPRFSPKGLTVLDGGGQWAGPENRLIRDSAKVVVLVLPEQPGDEQRSLGEVRQAYQQRFKQDAVSMVTQKACVAL